MAYTSIGGRVGIEGFFVGQSVGRYVSMYINRWVDRYIGRCGGWLVCE